MQMRGGILGCVLTGCAWLAGCAQLQSSLPTSGPSAEEVARSATAAERLPIQIVDVDEAVTRQLLLQRTQRLFSESLGNSAAGALLVGPGDVLEVNIWEAVPATLFGTAPTTARGAPSTSRATTLPEQVVSDAGTIAVPFAGAIKASQRTLQQIEAEIVERLKGKANQPQVMVRSVRNVSTNVTVVGEVPASGRVPLTPRGERLLDALAAAGGSRQPVNKTTVQVTRGNAVHALPLETIIRDPQQNIPLRPGDVVTLLFQPLSFTALGATGKNDEINFEAQGISLSQALARVGGLLDARSNAQGVFLFRFEPQGALDWPRKPVSVTPEGQVPVIYRLDLKNPASFFVMQSFPIQNKDIIYVSNAPAAELQKFLNILTSSIFSVVGLENVGK